jgi:hypothetical protein
MPKTRLVEIAAAGCLALALGAPATTFAAPPSSLNAPLMVQNKTNKQAKKSQDKIDKLADKKTSALQDYLTTMTKIDRLKAYNSQLSKLIQSQQQQIASKQNQLKNLGTEAKEVTPLMLKMISTLGQFVQNDLPYKRQQRLKHVKKLSHIMDSSDVSLAEKFRQITDSYMNEITNGNKIGTYRGSLNTNGESRTVDFLRIGRVALMYQTLDGSETGFYNRQKKQWVVDNDLSDQVSRGLAIARKAHAPGLLVAPVPAPKPAEAK